MHARRQYLMPIAATILLWLAVVLLFSYCQYYVDPDAVAYLTIAKRYARGDYFTAINGYWSPWACWLTALGIKAGWEAFTSAIVVNTIAATGFLWVSDRLFRRFQLQPIIYRALLAILVPFLASAVYLQSFADLWQCFFLLLALQLMLSEPFRNRPAYWILYGIIGTLSYYAKAYSFSFFILNTIVCGLIMMKGWQKDQRKRYLAMVAISLLTMISLSSPWIFLLHEKYGMWTTSTAGKLNLSWYLVGEPFYKNEIGYFLPPAYADSPYYWEDPYLVNGATPHFYSSWHYFKLQIVRFGYNLLKLINSLNAFSAFALPTWLLALLIVLPTRIRSFFSDKIRIAALSVLLFPMGFLLINFEPRYIWYTYPITLALSALALQYLLTIISDKRIRLLTIGIYTLSFIAGPVWHMKPIIHAGKTEYQLAQALREKGIQGSFATNALSADEHQRAARLAYFSGNSYYFTPINTQHARARMQEEIQHYGIQYYVYLPNQHHPDNAFVLYDNNGVPYPEIPMGDNQIKIFLLQQQAK